MGTGFPVWWWDSLIFCFESYHIPDPPSDDLSKWFLEDPSLPLDKFLKTK